MNYLQIPPHDIGGLIDQIYAHPGYNNLDDSIKYSFEHALYFRYNRKRPKETTKWVQELWDHLYLNEKEPLPLFI